MNITSGKIQSAQKIILFGVEGIGKSTFASRFPDPLFIDTEGSTRFLDVKRFDAPSSWTMLMQQIDYVINNKPCSTLVLDTIDWAEKLCYDHVCSNNNWKSIETPGYGAGYRYAYEEMGKLLNRLSDVTAAGINVVITAHAALRKFEQPDEMGSYDRYEMKLQTSQKCNTASMVKEWADCVLFANYKTIVVKDGKGDNAKNKAQGSRRVMYATHHACWDAKNRYGLPDELSFDYSEIAPYITGSSAASSQPSVVPPPSPPPAPVHPAPVQQPNNDNTDDIHKKLFEESDIPAGTPKALADLMRANSVSEAEIRLAVSQKGYYPHDTPILSYDPDFIDGVLVGAWQQVFGIIKKNRETPFFGPDEDIPF